MPGKSNPIVDAVSRNIPVVPVSQISTFSLPELRSAQRQDNLWFSVIYALESGDSFSLPQLHVPFLSFTLQDDVI